MTPLAKLEIAKVFQHDAQEILAARNKALLLHSTKDIDAAGDELEEVIRRIFRRKMPDLYKVGHGHIVDSKLATSPQFDLIVADNSISPLLFTSENGTQYFTYESVYAIGEIKTTYRRNKNYVSKFIDDIAKVRSGLTRENTPRNYLTHGISLGDDLDSGVRDKFRNPLFSFMFFGDSGDFKVEDVRHIYEIKPPAELPNIICFLDRGVLINVCVEVKDSGKVVMGSVNTCPELDHDFRLTDKKWVFVPFGTSEFRLGSNFAMLYFYIIHHVKRCVLMRPNILDYVNHMFVRESGEVVA